MTEAGANEDNGDSAAMSEWMKVMLGEMERKRAEQQEAEEELARRGEGADHGGDDAERPGEPKDPSSTA